MRADTLIKKSQTIEEIYESIKMQNEHGNFKMSFPNSMYVSDEIKLELMREGYKVSIGDIGMGSKDLIIEW